MKPPRSPWGNFPDILIHASESAVKQHPAYRLAKSGDSDAASDLVLDNYCVAKTDLLASMFPGQGPTLVSAHAFEREGVNAIPEVFAEFLAILLGWPVDNGIVQKMS